MKRWARIAALVLAVSLMSIGTASAVSFLEPNGLNPAAPSYGPELAAAIKSLKAYVNAGYPVNGVKGTQIATSIESKGPAPTSISLSPMPSRFNSEEGFIQSGYTNLLSIIHLILIRPTPSNATVSIASANVELIGMTGIASDYATVINLSGAWSFYAKKPCKVKLTVRTDNEKSASKVITISKSAIKINSMSIYTKSATDANYVKKSVRTEYLPRDGQSHELKIAVATSPSNASFGGISQTGETILTTGAVKFTSSSGSVAQAFNTEPSENGFQHILMKKPGTVTLTAKATDGADLESFETFEAADCSGLPKDDVVLAAINRVAKDVSGLLKAPEAEPFVGPAIFSGRAAGVFFHEIFGHRVEGHRQKDETEGQTFTKSIGGSVLPNFLSVVFDPTRRKIGGIDLNGWYEYDDEGIKARPVTVVENGILKTFLMSRSPIEGIDHSNGHGRRQPGLEVVSRQSNLIVESSKSVPEARLRQMLVEEIKRQGKPYGLFFRDVT
jgi:hypothetical protein